MLINLFGRPSVGKSTLALELVCSLKKMGKSAEYIPEYAKEIIYKTHDQKEFSNFLLADQLNILAKQHKRIYDVSKSVDIAVCDSPLPLGLVYLNAESPLQNPASGFVQLLRK
jgi:RecA/RadA recombinase